MTIEEVLTPQDQTDVRVRYEHLQHGDYIRNQSEEDVEAANHIVTSGSMRSVHTLRALNSRVFVERFGGQTVGPNEEAVKNFDAVYGSARKYTGGGDQMFLDAAG